MIRIRKVQKWNGRNMKQFEKKFPEAWVTRPKSGSYLQMQIKFNVWLIEIGDGFLTKGDGYFRSIYGKTDNPDKVIQPHYVSGI